jgi:hypothetical protein
MVIYQKNNEPKIYLCIPHPDSSPEIIKQYVDSLYDGNKNTNLMLQAILYVLSSGMYWGNK